MARDVVRIRVLAFCECSLVCGPWFSHSTSWSACGGPGPLRPCEDGGLARPSLRSAPVSLPRVLTAEGGAPDHCGEPSHPSQKESKTASQKIYKIMQNLSFSTLTLKGLSAFDLWAWDGVVRLTCFHVTLLVAIGAGGRIVCNAVLPAQAFGQSCIVERCLLPISF